MYRRKLIYFILFCFVILCQFWFVRTKVAVDTTFKANFVPYIVEGLIEGTEQIVKFTLPSSQEIGFDPKKITVIVDDNRIAEVVGKKTFYVNSSTTLDNVSFVLKGQFLGRTSVKIQLWSMDISEDIEKQAETAVSDLLLISVVRLRRIIDIVFIASVGILVGVNHVNMGCCLDLNVVKTILKKPIGPVVGMICQFVFMPLMSFGLAYMIFSSPNMRLGLFTLGCSPGGGMSNVWTYFFKGNLDLSITMTFFSTIFAFATLPFWLFTLGQLIFDSSNIHIPYLSITISVAVFVIPLGIGLLFQRCLPKVTSICRRIFGPFSIFLILFITIFAMYVNFYMFLLFTWRMMLAGLCVACLGYVFGAVVAKLLRFSVADIVAISIETGFQNTGIPIFVLGLSIPQPDSDIASIIPALAAVMMVIPLLILLTIFRLRTWFRKRNEDKFKECENAPDASICLESNNGGTAKP